AAVGVRVRCKGRAPSPDRRSPVPDLRPQAPVSIVVLLEDGANLIDVARSTQGEHQFDSRFLTRKISAQYDSHFAHFMTAAAVAVCIEHAPSQTTRNDHYRKIAADRIFDSGHRISRDIAATECFDDETVSAAVDGVSDQPIVNACGSLDQIDSCIYGIGFDMLVKSGPPQYQHSIFIDYSEQTEIRALKSSDRFGVRLGYFA